MDFFFFPELGLIFITSSVFGLTQYHVMYHALFFALILSLSRFSSVPSFNPSVLLVTLVEQPGLCGLSPTCHSP